MHPEDLAKLFAEYQHITDRYVTPRLKYYADRVDNKRRLAQWSRGLVLLLSLSIPVVANVSQPAPGTPPKELIVSLMSLLIALASGLEGLHQWQNTWREYSSRIIQIETLIALWEVQVTSARQLPDVKEISEALKKATENLLRSVEKAVIGEMDTFFSKRSKAQQAQGGSA